MGAKTLLALDAALQAPTAPKPKAPKSTYVLATREYKLGIDAPKYVPDPGAGGWKSHAPELGYVALMASMDLGLRTFMIYGKDATNHLRHYFESTGKDYVIDLEAMIRDVPSARRVYEREVQQARAFIEFLPEGTHAIVSQQWDVGYNEQSENKNWFFAIGGYRVWGGGKVRVGFSRGVRQYDLEFEYHMKDRYNWDGGKQVEIPSIFDDDPIVITDHFMGEFHRQGLAREFFCVGTIRRRLTWSQGVPISQHQLHTPAGRT